MSAGGTEVEQTLACLATLFCAAQTGGEGRYTLVYGGGKGLPVGDYKVQLSTPVVVDSSGANQPVDPVKMVSQANLKSGSQKRQDTGPFPSKYGSTVIAASFGWGVLPYHLTFEYIARRA